MHGAVALRAGEPRVPPLQRISRLVVVEFLQRRNPMNQREILAVVFGMAFRAVFLIRELRMQPVPG